MNTLSISAPPAVVLVVDDEGALRAMMARALLLEGYAVHTAADAEAAVALAGDLPRPVDLVVTDLRMDPVGGSELAATLYARGLASRFLFVSGFGPAADYDERLGPFLPKPFSPRQLTDAVQRLLA